MKMLIEVSVTCPDAEDNKDLILLYEIITEQTRLKKMSL